MKYKKGDLYKIIPREDPSEWWIEEIISYNNRKFKVVTVAAGPGSNNGKDVGIADVRTESNDWLVSDRNYIILRINHRNTKLGKIFYK